MFWIIFFRNKINQRWIMIYFIIATLAIIIGAWHKLNGNPIANLFLMSGLGFSIDVLLMSVFKNKEKLS